MSDSNAANGNPLATNDEQTICSACCRDLSVGLAVVLRNCKHPFCSTCIKDSFSINKTDKIQCPYPFKQFECGAKLEDDEVAHILEHAEASDVAENTVPRELGRARSSRASAGENSALEELFEIMQLSILHSSKDDLATIGVEQSKTLNGATGILHESGNKTETTLTNSPSNSDLAPNREAFECPTCNKKFQAYTEVMLSECFHMFCKQCLVKTVQQSEEVRVQCPALANGDEKCTAILLDNEIRALLSKEEYIKYQDKCVQQAKADIPNSVHCLKPNCLGWIIVDGYIDSFNCPVCSGKNCVSCKAIHTGQTCKVYQDSLVPNKGKDNIHDLLVLSDANLAPNPEAFECPICSETFQAQKEAMLSECFHMFCKECLAQTVKHAEDVEVTCPAVDCTAIILDKEIRALLTSEEYGKFQERCIQQAEIIIPNTIHCLKPNCPGWIEALGNLASFKCSVCSTKNCIKCKAIHTSQTCKDYKATLERKEEDLLSEKQMTSMVETRESMRCPGCGVMIMKNKGCDFIRCTQCKTEICWPTRGRRWGPGGQGDNSGGCGCKIEKRCHPECEGCHF